jgi:cell division GTPase FtsZ
MKKLQNVLDKLIVIKNDNSYEVYEELQKCNIGVQIKEMTYMLDFDLLKAWGGAKS